MLLEIPVVLTQGLKRGKEIKRFGLSLQGKQSVFCCQLLIFFFYTNHFSNYIRGLCSSSLKSEENMAKKSEEVFLTFYIKLRGFPDSEQNFCPSPQQQDGIPTGGEARGQHLVPAEGIRSGEGLQHHEAAEVLEGEIWDVPDLVEGQGDGLERWQVVQGSHRDLGQGVIVQPQVTQGQQPLKAPVGNHGDEVGIQAAGEEKERGDQ